ncbi:MAG: thioredoxin domain-containing protein [Desulfobacterales bacterium]|jgi:hypothetical protein
MSRNRLAHEKSPYLQQHADNPVDWFPWGEAAFARAAELDRPVFLSIGYATCHWCHVMEKESFEDPEVAAVLNDGFVSVKVDREERPDVDAVYMAVCQMLTGSGGWPLTLALTPEREPFFAATYLPKTSRFGRPGLIEIGGRIVDLWKNDRGRLLEAASGIRGRLGRAFRYDPSEMPGAEVFDSAFSQLQASFDPVHGGFGGAPKFPTPHRLSFLLRYGHRTGNARAVEMVEKTLTAMRRGGVWDHVGFGFHRYATDAQWFLPHFEKMLYDQALLADVYLKAGRIPGHRRFLQTAEEIFAYVLRDMTDPEGGFYTAEDADSEGEEGRFYVWTADAFRKAAADDQLARRWARILGVTEDGNFAEEASGEKSSANLLSTPQPISAWARRLGFGKEALAGEWKRLCQRLLEIRSRRKRPLRDEKILTDCNGLMIAALADGARILGVPEYGRAARRAARFVLAKMRTPDGRLLHRFRDKEAGIAGMADDYAFLIAGLLALYRAFFDPEDLAAATVLQRQMIEDFWDDADGGFFMTTAEASELPVRPKTLYDGAQPSANSVALENLMRLSRLTGDPQWETRAKGLAASVAGTVVRQPTAFTRLLEALDSMVHPGKAIVIAGEPESPDTRAMLDAAEAPLLPAAAVLLRTGKNARRLAELAPFTRQMAPKDGRAAAYLGSGRNGEEPVTDPGVLSAMLQGDPPAPGAGYP